MGEPRGHGSSSMDDDDSHVQLVEGEATGKGPGGAASGTTPGADCREEEREEEEEESMGDGEACGDEGDVASIQAQREANVRALLSGSSLVVARAPLLSTLRVTDADTVLRRPFKSPHPSAPAVSEALRRRLAARRRFVPWGGSKPSVPTAPPRPPSQEPVPLPDADAVAAAASAQLPPPEEQLSPGVEPLVLWDPRQQADGRPADVQAAAVVAAAAVEVWDGGVCDDAAIEVDPMLTKWLRPHQREGVAFMFECVTGLRMAEGRGCILADDMGLGKTLQAIALMWTLLNKGAHALGGRPLARRAIICCPTSLVGNWSSECTKWLKGRVRVLALCEASREEVSDGLGRFLSPACPYHCLVVSYETLRLHAARLAAAGEGACDLLICDEAHRLKNDQTLTNRALAGIHCARRVLLSGTPMQNHLDEFYAMCNFTNPGVLGPPSEFRRYYEAPILTGREPGSSPEDQSLAEERSQELSAIVNQFILRRTNRLLSAHLPPKVVMVVCCRLTPLQRDLYTRFLESTAARRVLARAQQAGGKRAGAAGVLSAITTLKKLCNHPRLIYDALLSKGSEAASALEAFDSGGGAAPATASDLFPPGVFDSGRPGRGGMAVGWEALGSKMAVVARLLGALRESSDDKAVIVSNYTQTLDLFAALCRERGWGALRLDGSTSVGKRQKLVAQFNDPRGREFVFLLSSKAGGCGLNLVGANRLVLFDPDWNPANDKQAAGRVWRDGQQKRVYVYRMLSTGTIEEKVFQRQISKEGLQQLVDSAAGGQAKGGQDPDSLGDRGGAGQRSGKKGGSDGASVGLLSAEQLRQLFSLRADVASDTYDIMFREGDGAGDAPGGGCKDGGGKSGGGKGKGKKKGGKGAKGGAAGGSGWREAQGAGGGRRRAAWDGSSSGDDGGHDGSSHGEEEDDDLWRGGGGQRRRGRQGPSTFVVDLAGDSTTCSGSGSGSDSDSDSGHEGAEEELGAGDRRHGAAATSGGGGDDGGSTAAAAAVAMEVDGANSAGGGGPGRVGVGADEGVAGALEMMDEEWCGPDGPKGGHRPQVGCPAEDDLRSFGLHSAAALDTVPDEMLRRAAEGEVTFVFSNAIAGKEVEAAAPAAAAGAAAAPAAAAGAAAAPGSAGRALAGGSAPRLGMRAGGTALAPATGPAAARGPIGGLPVAVTAAETAMAAGRQGPLSDAGSRANVKALVPAAKAALAGASRKLPQQGAAVPAAAAAALKRPRLAGARVVPWPSAVHGSDSGGGDDDDDDFA